MAEPRAGLQGNAYLRKLLRQQWRSEHVANGSPTAAILRAGTTSAAGNPPVGKPPTIGLAAGLTGLNVAVGHPGDYRAETPPLGGPPLRQDERIFSFLDVPSAGGVAANTICASDFISFEGRTWSITAVQNDTAIGTSHARAQLWGR